MQLGLAFPRHKGGWLVRVVGLGGPALNMGSHLRKEAAEEERQEAAAGARR